MKDLDANQIIMGLDPSKLHCITDLRNMQLAYIMVEREEAEVEDPWGDHQLPPDILPHTVR
jgi:hypothetical protein